MLGTGDTYTLDVLVPTVPAEKDLAGRATAVVTLPDIVGDPEPVQTLAVEWATAATPMGRLNALLTRMRAGAYSDGTGAAGVPSRPGHGAGRVREFLAADQLVGDSEQYAATLALMLRRLGIPARVVLGAAPTQAWFAKTGTGAGDVTGAMVTAWVEVAVDGVGWVPFDPTPPVTNKPKPPKPEPNEDGDAKIVQPPTVALPAPDQAAPPDADDSGDDLPPPDRCGVCAVLLTIATRGPATPAVRAGRGRDRGAQGAPAPASPAGRVHQRADRQRLAGAAGPAARPGRTDAGRADPPARRRGAGRGGGAARGRAGGRDPARAGRRRGRLRAG
ncbi:transglutaminase-like domain-containing protein [Luedemannella flava]